MPKSGCGGEATAHEAPDKWARALPRKPVPYVIGLIVAVGLPRLLGLALRPLGAGGIQWSWLTSWLTVAALALLVVRLERLPLRTLFPGRPCFRHLGAALAFAVVLRLLGPVPLLAAAWFLPRRPEGRGRSRLVWAVAFLAVAVAGVGLFGLAAEAFSLGTSPAGNRGRELITSLSTAERLVLVVTAAATEEVRYRAYLIDRLHGLGLAPGAAAVASCVVFVAAHIPFFGLEHVVRVTAIGGACFPILYYLTRSFWACFALHFLLDIFILAA